MKRKEKNSRVDIHERITRKIVTDLEQGVRPWVKPWSSGHADGRPDRCVTPANPMPASTFCCSGPKASLVVLVRRSG